MNTLWRVYLREWLGLLLLSLLLVSSAYLVSREYYTYQYRLRRLELLEARLKEARILKQSLLLYDRYPFWRTLGPPQEIQIREKLGLYPLEESLTKLSSLYVERGFFFLKSFKLETCLDTRPGRRHTCTPYFEVEGRKALF